MQMVEFFFFVDKSNGRDNTFIIILYSKKIECVEDRFVHELESSL